jgi:hypothetical protein
LTQRQEPRLLIGPVLRRVVGDRATVWVETSAPATVAVQAGPASGAAHTFSAFGHHYALVVVTGLPAAAATPYQMTLDDVPVWPQDNPEYPPSVIRTRPPADIDDQPVRLVFGSCREATPKTVARRLPPDALDAYARRLANAALGVPASTDGDPIRDWPDTLVLLGDQVYADKTSPRMRRWLRRRPRAARNAPNNQVISFHEYTRLYLESWRDPEIRWLFSTVPSVMIFDDHEIIDDWNSSAAWRAHVRDQPWWITRIASGLASYWVYQHLGNLHPDQLATDPIYRAVLAAADDATEVLREFGARADEDGESRPAGYQWSYALDIAGTRLVVLDNRCSRVLDPAHRAMLPEGEWQWFEKQAHGRYDHLVVGSSLPWLMPPAIHHVEAWNERLAVSSRPRVALLSERLRRAFDLEHWAAFQRSFELLGALFAQLGSDRRPETGESVARDGPPASISVLSGDVHHSYVARADLGDGVVSPVHQLTCSPIHNHVPAAMRPALKLGWGRAAAAAARALARGAGLPRPGVRWRKLTRPYFGNAIGTLVHTGRSARVTIEGTTSAGRLHPVARLPLTRSGAGAFEGGPLDRRSTTTGP